MEAVIASVVAVAGTLLGSYLTYVLQQRTTERARHVNRGRQRRQEQLDAYCAFIGALMDYRRNLYFRWRLNDEEAPEEQRREERSDTYRLLVEAEQALVRVQLITQDSALMGMAKRSLEAPSSLRHAQDKTDLFARRDEVARIHNDFIQAVARTLP